MQKWHYCAIYWKIIEEKLYSPLWLEYQISNFDSESLNLHLLQTVVHIQNVKQIDYLLLHCGQTYGLASVCVRI